MLVYHDREEACTEEMVGHTVTRVDEGGIAPMGLNLVVRREIGKERRRQSPAVNEPRAEWNSGPDFWAGGTRLAEPVTTRRCA